MHDPADPDGPSPDGPSPLAELPLLATRAVGFAVEMLFDRAYGLRRIAEAAVWGRADTSSCQASQHAGAVRHRYNVTYVPPLYGCRGRG